MKNEFVVGEWVHIPMDSEPYKITAIYEKDGEIVVDLDDGDNYTPKEKLITLIKKIPKRKKVSE